MTDPLAITTVCEPYVFVLPIVFVFVFVLHLDSYDECCLLPRGSRVGSHIPQSTATKH
jgi:hypothetical protein